MEKKNMKPMMRNWNFNNHVKAFAKFFLPLLALGTFTSCDLGLSGDDKDQTELEKLPPLTTTGENTFGCLVNGEAFVSKHSLDITAIYQRGGLQLSGRMEVNQIDRDVKLVLNDPLEEGIEYSLTNLPLHRARYRNGLDKDNCWYDYQHTFNGRFIFSKIDRTNYVISGTFEFSTATEECDTVHITNGRFDMQYVP